jgi:hypothetical protein
MISSNVPPSFMNKTKIKEDLELLIVQRFPFF